LIHKLTFNEKPALYVGLSGKINTSVAIGILAWWLRGLIQ
jgi:hypothetical protein